MANEIHSFARDIFHSRNRGRLVILYGPNGCGKTHAAKSLRTWFNAVRLKIGPVAVQTDEGSEAQIADCAYRMWPAVVDGFKRDQWEITQILSNEYLTILDDVGAEHDPSRIGIEKLYLILSRREQKHTLITTNVPPQHWETKFEKRIASRLFRNSTHINLSEVPDYNA